MRFVSFEIQNFRGIKRSKVELLPAGAGVFTLIGLNESGKTTVLEAISTFQIRGGDEKALYQTKPSEIDPYSFVPKHEKATFTGNITVTAHVEFEDGDKVACLDWSEKSSGTKVARDRVPDSFTITRGYRFANGDQVERINTWSLGLQVKEKGARSFKDVVSDHKAWTAFTAMVAVKMPEIVYFPTFLFELPSKIVLNPLGKEEPSDRLYRAIIYLTSPRPKRIPRVRGKRRHEYHRPHFPQRRCRASSLRGFALGW